MLKFGLLAILLFISSRITAAQTSSTESPSVPGQTTGASALQTKQETPKRVRVNQGVLKPSHEVPPTYPETARQLGIEGTVVLNALIGTDGKIAKLDAVSGNPALMQSAIDAVKQWRYKPLTVKGVPVEVETQIDVKFSRR